MGMSLSNIAKTHSAVENRAFMFWRTKDQTKAAAWVDDYIIYYLSNNLYINSMQSKSYKQDVCSSIASRQSPPETAQKVPSIEIVKTAFARVQEIQRRTAIYDPSSGREASI